MGLRQIGAFEGFILFNPPTRAYFLLSRVSPLSKVDIGLMNTWSYCWVTSETPPSPQVSRSRLRLIAVWVLVALNTGAADIDTE